MKVQNKAELAAVETVNAQREAQYQGMLAAWQEAHGAFLEDPTLLNPGPQPEPPTPVAEATVYDVADVTEPEEIDTPWGTALLIPGMKKLTAPDGTVLGVTAADFAASWLPS